MATDVCGYLVERLSGVPLDRFFRDRIFEPLGMADTGFSVSDEQAERMGTCYVAAPANALHPMDNAGSTTYREDPTFLSGGGGLVSTASDYLRFALMLLNGGELDGRRILGRKTVEYMTSNHLPTGGDLASIPRETCKVTTARTPSGSALARPASTANRIGRSPRLNVSAYAPAYSSQAAMAAIAAVLTNDRGTLAWDIVAVE